MRVNVGWRHIREFVVGTLATFAALWLVVESFSAFLPDLKPRGPDLYGVLWIASAVGGLCRAWPPRRINLPIPASGSSLEVRFGDVFDGDGAIVIPVNEYFDGEIGDYVSPKSLHGKFIQTVLGGQSKTFGELTNQALAHVVPEQAGVERKGGRCDRYAIGTVARVDINDRRYLLAALSHTDLDTLKAHASVADLWSCLAGVWSAIRQHSGGRSVRVPLIGSGLSGVGLPTAALVGVIATSLLDHTKKREVANRVTLVLPSHLARKFDLRSLKDSYI